MNVLSFAFNTRNKAGECDRCKTLILKKFEQSFSLQNDDLQMILQTSRASHCSSFVSVNELSLQIRYNIVGEM